MNEGLYRQLWAKSEPHHKLWRHLLDVAAVVEALWPRFGQLEAMPPRWAAYLCALHDIGKADPWFQNKDETLASQLRDAGLSLPQRSEATNENILRFRHEARSFKWLIDALPARHGWSLKAARVVTHAINGHHGNFAADCYDEDELYEQKEMWGSLRDQLAQLVWDVLEPPHYAPQKFEHASALGMTLSGLIVLADWIASNHEIYDYPSLQNENDARKYFNNAGALAVKVVEELGFKAVEVVNAAQSEPPRFSEVWPEIKNLRPVQSALESEVLSGNIAPGLAIIEAPMGEGKTEAAIYLSAWWNRQRGKNGAYLALPTQATSNQMHRRYCKYLQIENPDAEPRLVHGMAWLIDEKTQTGTAQTYGWDASERLLSREWFRPLRRALLAPDGVGTVDQAMMVALHVKFGFLRLLGLKSKVLIIDEAHAYDVYMTTILERLLNWCRALQIPVILLSATLSQQQKSRLICAYGGDATALQSEAAYPLLTFLNEQGIVREVCVAPDASRERTLQLTAHHGSLDDATATARLALERVQNGGCICVLMNSVGGAQSVYREIERLLDEEKWTKPDELLLFHARFRAEDRNAIEEKVTRLFGVEANVKDGTRPIRAIVVATQVVEQSLDVDFDFFITQIAPIDLLLQRSGRLWRHERPRLSDTPTLEVLWPSENELQFGVSELIYAREIMLRAAAVLHTRREIQLPQEFRALIEAVYGTGEISYELVPRDRIEAAANERQREHLAHTAQAQIHLLPTPNERTFSLLRHAASESEEGAAADYFRASTRLGNDSRAALVLHDSELIKIAQSSLDKDAPAPKMKQLRRLFANKVNLPAWWLREREAADGYATIFDGQNWLRGHVIVALRDGEWHAANGAVMRDEEKLGLCFDARDEKGEEADAGLTG